MFAMYARKNFLKQWVIPMKQLKHPLQCICDVLVSILILKALYIMMMSGSWNLQNEHE